MFKPIRTRAMNRIAQSYVLGLFDSSFPLMYSLPGDLVAKLDGIVYDGNNKRDLAKHIFNLCSSQITYGQNKKQTGYASAKNVWRNKEGVCGEMSYVYVTSARYCGLKSSYTSVLVDLEGTKVNHACATVWVPEPIQVDIAYRLFDIRHIKTKLRSDREVYDNYLDWSSR